MKLSISTKILLSFLSGFIALGIVVVVSVFFIIDDKDKAYRKLNTHLSQNIWSSVLEEQKTKMSASISAIARDTSLRTALFHNDAKKVKYEAVPTFIRLNSTNVFDNLILTNSKGDFMFSGIKGIDTSPKSVSFALKEKKTVNDLYETESGELVTSIAFPIYDRADIAGIAVFEKKLDDATKLLKKITEQNVTIINSSGEIMSSTLEDNDLSDVVLATSEKYTKTPFKEKIFNIGRFPLKSLSGEKVGTLITIGDVTTKELATARNLKIMIIGIVTIVFILLGVILTYVRKSILSPLLRISDFIRQAADGNTNFKVTDTERRDEIGDMAKSIEVFKKNRSEADQLTKEQEQLQKENLERAKKRDSITKNFESDVSEIVQILSSATSKLDTTARSMSDISKKTILKSEVMYDSSKSTNENIDAVNDAAKELVTSIKELSMQVNNTSQATNSAIDNANSASNQIEQLLTASEEIDDVVKLIRDIAEQTNLLALNATIESARAGEAGKGFSVVANEVKSLAQETASATEQIAKQVNTVQNETRSAVEAIKKIEMEIKTIGETASSIAAAIEEQNAATENISQSTQFSSSSMQELGQHIESVNKIAQDTETASSEVLESSDSLSGQINDLKEKVDNFTDKINSV